MSETQPVSRDVAAMIAFIEAAQGRPFGWRRGRDCVSFALACVKAQTGFDLLAGIPGWRTRRQALAVAERLGGLKAALDAQMMRIAPALAARGDVAGVADDDFGVRLMVVEGATLVGPGTHGLQRLDRSAMVMAWSAIGARSAGDE